MGGTRWLSEDEQRTWRTFVMATKLLWDQLEQETRRADGGSQPLLRGPGPPGGGPRAAVADERPGRPVPVLAQPTIPLHRPAGVARLDPAPRPARRTAGEPSPSSPTRASLRSRPPPRCTWRVCARTSSTNSTLSSSRSCGGSASECSNTWWLSKDRPPRNWDGSACPSSHVASASVLKELADSSRR